MADRAPDQGDRLSILEGRVEDLARAVDALQQRLALAGEREEGAPAAPARARYEPVPAEEEVPLPSASDLTRILGLTGRTLIVFGGAYLLRAFTAGGYLPEAVGVALAFLYALGWLFLADRAGAKGALLSAEFHGATAVFIGLPLLWETTVRFHYLEPAASGVAVALFAGAALALAWRRRLQGLGWVVALGVPVTALFLLAGTHVTAPFAFDLVLLGVGGLVLYYGRSWHALGGWMALMGPAGGLLATFGALAQQKDEGAALAVGFLLGLSYLAILVHQTLVRDLEVGVFEVVQAGLAVALGYGGAALVALRLGGWAVVMAGALALALAAVAYLVSFWRIPRERRAKLLLYSSLALAFALSGSGLLLPPTARAVAWSVLAVLAGWQAVRQKRVTLSLHGAFYSVAAAAASGLLAAAAYAFGAPADTAWPPLAPEAFLSLAAAAFLCALPVPHPAPFWKPYEGLTRVLQLSVFLWGAAGVALHLLLPAVPGVAADAGPGPEPAFLATLRTAVLVAVALLLGWVARWERFREAAWLVYPALLVAGLKLLAEDFPNGRPATLFVALALCGLAFIFAPRLARKAA
jgi:hypothetical protein